MAGVTQRRIEVLHRLENTRLTFDPPGQYQDLRFELQTGPKIPTDGCLSNPLPDAI